MLAALEFAIEESLVDFQSGWDAGQEGDEGLSVRFSGSEVAQHKFLIVPDWMAGTCRFRAQFYCSDLQAEGKTFTAETGRSEFGDFCQIRRAGEAREENLLSRPTPSVTDHLFFILVPIRNNFLTVPVGSRFI